MPFNSASAPYLSSSTVFNCIVVVADDSEFVLLDGKKGRLGVAGQAIQPALPKVAD